MRGVNFGFLLLCISSSLAKEWWQNSIVYQVYPRSFQDSDGDGTGDIKGIQSRLPYLSEIGIETVWISPVYKSPMADFGYDISDFMDIDPIFGTLADFKTLVESARELGIKIVMDFVPNHSSDQHKWFTKSVAQIEPYTDYYIWKDPSGFDEDGTPIPPNNWLSVFRFSAWKYVEERKQFYYHAFTPEQPDLNYRNPLVVEEMMNVLRFWFGEIGLSGLRMDAVPFMFEDERFLDEPVSNKTSDPDAYDYLDHIYTWNLPEHYEMIQQFNDILSEYEAIDDFDRVMMVEALSADFTTADLMNYYNFADFPFNFNFVLHLGENTMAGDIELEILDWLENMPNGKTANWVLDNHDNPRVGTKIGEKYMDPMNMISLLLPGVAVTYQGDEIGMTNTNISYADTVDPAGCNCGPDNYQICSRDPERTPMQWSSDKNAGFSNADSTWLPVNPNYLEVNVEAQKSAEESHLKVYQALSNLRKSDVRIQSGFWDTMLDGDQVLGIARHVDYNAIILAFNTGTEAYTANFQPGPLEGTATVLIRSSGSTNPGTMVGTQVDLSQVTLEPYEAVVIDFQFTQFKSGLERNVNFWK